MVLKIFTCKGDLEVGTYVVIPKAVLAGTAFSSSQNDTHETMTSMIHGIYI